MRFDDISEGVAGPKNCWPGHRKVGTQPGTGKNAGKRVNKCEKIKESALRQAIQNGDTPGANLEEIYNPTSAIAGFLRSAASIASDLLPVGIAAAGTFAATSAVLGPVAAAIAGNTVGSQLFQTLQNQQNKVPGFIQQMIEKYFGSEAEAQEFALVHAKAAFLNETEFRWRGQQWSVTLKKNEAEAIIEKNDKYWLEQHQTTISNGIDEGLNDDVADRDVGEYDREGEMAMGQLKTAEDAAAELRSILDADENLPEWIQSKITKAVDYLDTVRDYMKSKEQGVAEAGPYGSRNPDLMSPNEYDRYQQDQMDHSKKAFKRAEHQAEWEREQQYTKQLQAQERGPWYLRIDGKVYRQKGQPKMFDHKKGANNYALAMIKNNPGLQGKIMLTKNTQDQ